MITVGKDEFIISCNCGCANIEFKKSNNYIYISVNRSEFYNKQHDPIYREKKQIQKIYCNILKKNNSLLDLVIEENEIEDFLDALKTLNIEQDEIKATNDSYLKLEKEQFYNINNYILVLYNKQNLKNLIFKEFYSYELVLNKQQYEKFIELCENVINN